MSSHGPLSPTKRDPARQTSGPFKREHLTMRRHAFLHLKPCAASRIGISRNSVSPATDRMIDKVIRTLYSTCIASDQTAISFHC